MTGPRQPDVLYRLKQRDRSSDSRTGFKGGAARLARYSRYQNQLQSAIRKLPGRAERGRHRA